MYATVKTLSVLALAGSVLAVPVADSQLQRRGGWGEWKWGNRPSGGAPAAPSASAPWTNWASTATVYVTAESPAPTAAPAAPSPAPAETTAAAAPSAGGQFFGKPSSDWAAPSSAPAAAPSSAPAAPAPASDGSWQGIVAEWRSNLGLSTLTDDATLTANAQKTVDESVGGLKHELNPGSMAQVLAPGNAGDFEHVFVGGWLCELPNTPGLNGVCATQSQGWSYDGQTGHAEILTSPAYSKIGCAFSDDTGVWGCDLA